MDEYSSRRIAGGLVISRKGPSLVSRDSAENNGDQNDQVCSRVGCSSRVNSVKTTQFGSPGKAKASKMPFRPFGHGKETIASSSRSSVLVNTSRRSFFDPKKKLPVETDSETSSLNDESEEESQYIPTSGKTETRFSPEPENHEGAEATSSATGSSSLGSMKRFVKSTRTFGSNHRDGPAGSSTSFASKQGNQGTRNGASTSTSRYNLRSLRCNSISDVVPSGYSSFSESALSRSDVGRKRIGEPENSLSAKGKKISGHMMDDRRNDSAIRGISISDSRQSRNLSPSRDDGTLSLRMRRLTGRTRGSNRENPNRLSLLESPLLIASSPELDVTIDSPDFSPENQLSSQNPLNRSCTFSRAGGIRDHTRSNRSLDPHDVGVTHPFLNRDALRQYNLDAIAEMLLALERIEQAEETTYEQLLVDSNIFLGGLAFHDHHREMRLDIDNMSYEELLALEERMGTVSTALSEEALAKCLKRSIYQGTTDCRNNADCRNNEDDVKCSICQEEYGDGDEVGRLGCEHRYHVECIHQWLRLKNWCPICKASATPLRQESPPP